MKETHSFRDGETYDQLGQVDPISPPSEEGRDMELKHNALESRSYNTWKRLTYTTYYAHHLRTHLKWDLISHIEARHPTLPYPPLSVTRL